jgi:hypothetical protein
VSGGKNGDYAERVSSTPDAPEDVRVLGRGSLDERAVGEDNISGNNLVHRETPMTRGVSVTTVGEVSTNTNARACSVRKRLLALCVDTISKVAETDTTADLGDAGACVEFDLLEGLKTDHHCAVLAARAEACV